MLQGKRNCAHKNAFIKQLLSKHEIMVPSLRSSSLIWFQEQNSFQDNAHTSVSNYVWENNLQWQGLRPMFTKPSPQAECYNQYSGNKAAFSIILGFVIKLLSGCH